MASLDEQMQKDSAEIFELDDQKSKSVAELGKSAKNLAAEIAKTEQLLKDQKQKLRKITEEQIPEALTSLGMASFTMVDGSQITVKKFYSASVPKGREAECFAYLREKGLDDIIKNQVSVGFGRGEDELAERLKKVLSDENFLFNEKQSVHPKTLEATVKEQVELGNEFDLQLFNGYIGQRAVIKT